jgi:hypothetical protein
MEQEMRIDCDECVMQGTEACADCVVTFLCCDTTRPRGVVLDADEARALRLLAGGGLAPRLRHVRRRASVTPRHP